MAEQIAIIGVLAVSLYVLVGFLFAIPFVIKGAPAIDHAARGTKWGFRLIIIPGVSVFWPMLLRRWMKGMDNPPEEKNPHRVLACQHHCEHGEAK